MQTLVDLPLVSCELGLSDGVADIKSFQAGAANAGWTRDEINVAVVKAVYGGIDFDDVGEVLRQYCACEGMVPTMAV